MTRVGRARLWRLFLLPVLLFACADVRKTATPRAEEEIVALQPSGAAAQPQMTATPFVLPTLLPTATSEAPETAAPPNTPAPEPSPESTLDFEQPVLELRYRIPALQLDRRLEGNVSGQITVVDETKGVAAIRQNQGGVLLELQEFLPTVELEPAPESCETCVLFSYSMPIVSAAGEGWLQDPVLLASVENYTSALLGPHFPPGTVLGLRRSATSYDVAHSLALSSTGALYRWLATEGEIEEAIDVNQIAPELGALLSEAQVDSLREQYAVDCVSTPVETLYLHPNAGTAAEESPADEAQRIRIICPAFSLPRSLLPLYLRLDSLLEEKLSGSGLPRPPTAIALDTVIHYQREDGVHLEVALDGSARITSAEGVVTTTTALESSQTLSVTNALLDSEVLQPGLEAFVADELPNILLVRGEDGLLEAAWPSGALPPAIAETVRWLDQRIDLENEN